MTLDHERLDVYQVSLDFAAWAYGLSKSLSGMDRHARDQLLRASQSVVLNIAEGCGKSPSADRERYFKIAAGSARECGAVLDILVRCGVIQAEKAKPGKEWLVRIVAMLTKMGRPGRTDRVREEKTVYGYVNEYVYDPDARSQQSNAHGVCPRLPEHGNGLVIE